MFHALIPFALCITAAICSEPTTAEDAERLGIKQWYVPRDRVDKFRQDPTAAYQILPYAEFADLVRAAAASESRKHSRGPTTGVLFARVEPDRQRLAGSSTWVLPKGHGGAIELSPWNLRVTAVRRTGRNERPIWGMTNTGALWVRGFDSEAVSIDVDWDLAGEPPGQPWNLRGQTPRCGLTRMQVELPAGWKLRSSAAVETQGTDPKSPPTKKKGKENEQGTSHTLRLGGQSQWTLDLTPAELIAAHRPLVTYRTESKFRLGSVRMEFDCSVQVKIEKERQSEIRIRFDPGMTPSNLRLAGATAQWQRQPDVDGGAEWTLRFDRPQLGTIQVFASGALATPGGGLWTIPTVRAPGAVERGERVEILCDPALRLLEIEPGDLSLQESPDGLAAIAGLAGMATGVHGNEAGRIVLAGLAVTKRPRLHVGQALSESSVRAVHFLEVGANRSRLAARVDWECERGQASQPTFRLPNGWDSAKVTVEPPDRMRSPAVVEPGDSNDANGKWLRLPLARPLTTGERLRVWIMLEQTNAASQPTGGKTAIPEIRPLDATSKGVWQYAVSLDDATGRRLVGADVQRPLRDGESVKPPVGWVWPSEQLRVFRYLPPLSEAFLEAADAVRPSYDVGIRQELRWSGGEWTEEATIDLKSLRGEVCWFELKSNREASIQARWTWREGDDAGGDLQYLGVDAEGWHLYRLPIRSAGLASFGKTLRIVSKHQGPNTEPMLWRFPAAEHVVGRLAVFAETGARVVVDTTGVSPTALDAEQEPIPGNASLVWSARMDRVGDKARIGVKVTQPTSLDAAGSYRLWGRLAVEGSRTLAELQFELQATTPGGWSLPIRSGAKLWHAAVNGRPTVAWITRRPGTSSAMDTDVIELADPVPAGKTRVSILIEIPHRSSAGALVGMPVHWRKQSEHWAMETDGLSLRDVQSGVVGGLLWRTPDSSSTNRLSLSTDPAASTGLLSTVVRGLPESETREIRRAAMLLSVSPETLGLENADDLLQAVFRLQEQLPAGWIILLERRAMEIARATTAARNQRPNTTNAWLAELQLKPTLASGVMLLASRTLEGAVSSSGETVDASTLLQRRRREMLQGGGDPWGMFATPAELLGEWNATRGDSLHAGAFAVGAARAQQTWVLEADVVGSAAGELFFDRYFTHEDRSDRRGWIAWVGACVAAMLLGVRSRTIRLFVLAFSAALAVSADLIDPLLGPLSQALAWGGLCGTAFASVAVVVGYFLQRRNASRAAFLFISAAMCEALCNGGRIAVAQNPGDDVVLAPYDPNDASKPLTTVELPESLTRRLRAAALSEPVKFVVTRADYLGKLVDPERAEWSAKLELHSFGTETPIRAAVGFIGMDIRNVRSGDKPVRHLAPTPGLPLVLQLPSAGKWVVDLDFSTAVVRVGEERRIEAALPLAGSENVRLTGFSEPIELAPHKEMRGFRLTRDPSGESLVGVGGPRNALQLAWRTKTQARPPTSKKPTAVACVLLKPESGESFWEWTAKLKWTNAEKPSARLELSVPRDLFIRRVEGAGVESWDLETPPQGNAKLVVSFAPSEANESVLTILGWYSTGGRAEWGAPTLACDALDLRGAVGVLAPTGGRPTVRSTPGSRLLTNEEFQDAWKWMQGGAAGGTLGGVLAGAATFDSAGTGCQVVRDTSVRRWKVSQDHRVDLAGTGGWADWQAAVNIEVQDRPADLLRFRLPKNHLIERVEGNNIFQWFESDGFLHVRYARPLRGSTALRFSGVVKLAGEPTRKLTLAAIEPDGGVSAESSWLIVSGRDFRLTMPADANDSLQSLVQDGELEVRHPAGAVQFSVDVESAPIKMNVLSGVAVRRIGSRWILAGVLETRSTGGRSTGLEVRIPLDIGPVEWQAPGFRIFDRGAADGERRWYFEPRAATASERRDDRWRWEWRATATVREGEQSLRVSAPKVQGASSAEHWFVAAAKSEGVPSSTEAPSGPKAGPPKKSAGVLPASLEPLTAVLAAGEREAWTADSATFQNPVSDPSEPLKLVFVGHELCTSAEGVRGVSVWWIEDARIERFEFQAPTGFKLEEAVIDGRAVPSGCDASGVWVVGQRRSDRQRLVVRWQRPGLDPLTLLKLSGRMTAQSAEFGCSLCVRGDHTVVARDWRHVSARDWWSAIHKRELAEAQLGWDRRSSEEDRTGFARVQSAYYRLREILRADQASEALKEVDALQAQFASAVSRRRGAEAAKALEDPRSAVGARLDETAIGGHLKSKSAFFLHEGSGGELEFRAAVASDQAVAPTKTRWLLLLSAAAVVAGVVGRSASKRISGSINGSETSSPPAVDHSPDQC